MNPARGIAVNPSTPPRILSRLAARGDLADTLLDRDDLPPGVVAVLSAHPDPEVRRRLAGHPSTVGDVRAALAGDPAPKVRAAVAFGRRTPEKLRATLAGDPEPEVRRAVAWSARSAGPLLRLLGDPDREVRRQALSSAGIAGLTVPLPLAEPFLDDPRYRESAISLVALAPALIDRFGDERAALARNPTLPPDLMPGLLDEGPALAGNPNLPAPLLEALVAAGDPEVHRELLRRPDLPDHLRRRLVAADEDDEPLPHVPSLADAPLAERLSYLDHPNPAFRRTLAVCADLPTHAVERLASDADWPTRLLVCERHTDVPPDVLVEVAEGHPGHSRHDLFRHPRMPADALVRNAAGDDPVVRHAIATRTDLPPGLLPRLLDDPAPEVRRAAAANPTLPPDLLRQLLDDPFLREAAAANPALPVEEIERISSAVSGGPS